MLLSTRAARALPKAELHSHIDGSVSARELFRIAKENHRPMLTPGGDELTSSSAFMRYVEGGGYGTMLETIVDRFFPIINLMQTEETIRDVGASFMRAKKADGVVYVEGRFAPQYHTKEGMSIGDAIRSMAEGLAEGAEKYGVHANLIVAIGRESSARTGEEVARAAIASRSAVALDLGGPEEGNPPEKFAKAFDVARGAGLKVTIHAGEGAGSRRQNLANVRTAITRMGAGRVGHAIDLASSRELVSLVRAKSVAVEMNPISNLVLRKIRSPKDLRIDQLLDAGIRVSLNSDDPSLWPEGELSDVYSSVCSAYGFGEKELDTLAENAYMGAFIGDREKELLIKDYRKARQRL